MKENISNPEYTIQVTRKGRECIASIPDLCIACKGASPLEALSMVLQAEHDALRTIEINGDYLPQAGGAQDPFPRITRLIKKNLSFFTKVVVAYILVLSITVIIATVVFPSAKFQAEQYLLGQEAADDTRKILSRLGISLCLQNR